MRKQAFTIVEIIIAVTILSLVMVSVFGVYSNIVSLNKRLTVSRGLQENARNVTEIIAKDVRDNGIAFSCYDATQPSSTGCAASLPGTQYAGDWVDTFVTKVAQENCPGSSPCYVSYYLMHDNLASVPTKCTSVDKDCYLWRQSPSGERIRITDKTVRIDALHFFISGVDSKTFSSNGESQWKVTMTFHLSPVPRQWISPEVADSLAIPVQTTIAEKLYKAH